MKESVVQRAEVAVPASRPSVSASGARGTFSCRRWRLLSGKPSKDDEALRPSTAAVDSKNWATAATPFAAFLPRDTVVPTTARKSVAAAVLTSAFPPENVKTWDREMAICERKHVKAMARMATRIYRGKRVGEDASEPSSRQKSRELKDQIYLPTLSQARTSELSPRRPSKLPDQPHLREESTHNTARASVVPDTLSGMKLLSSQLDELRAGLEKTSEAPETSRKAERLWYPQPQRPSTVTFSRPTQTSNSAGRKTGFHEDTGSSSSSIETLLLRVLERPAACPDGYQADQEESTLESSDGAKTKSLTSRSPNNSEDDLLLLLGALDSTSQAATPSQEESSTSAASTNPPLSSITTSDLTMTSADY
jgi:hypothetical protein